MDSKKVIEQLVKIAEKQQKIINKLAQDMNQPPAQSYSTPQVSQKRPAEAILNALPANVKAGVAILEVHGEEVRLRVKPGVNEQAVYDGVFKAVTQLQNSNVLQGGSYTIKMV